MKIIYKVVGITISTVKSVLIEDLKLHKVYAKFVSKILSDDQKQFCVVCCSDILNIQVFLKRL